MNKVSYAFLIYPLKLMQSQKITSETMIKFKFLFTLLFFFSTCSFAQEVGTDYLWQLSPEIRIDTKKIEFRFRPQEIIILNNKELNSKTTFWRADLMIGLAFKKFKFFIYSKFDTRKQQYIGPRIDFNTTAFKKRLLLHGQYRFFRGFNGKSKDHQFVINIVELNTNPSSNKSFNFGLLGIYRQNFGSPAKVFQGPMIRFPFFIENVSFMLSHLKDFNARSRYFTFFQMKIKLKA